MMWECTMHTYGLKLTTRIGLFLMAYTPLFLFLLFWQFYEYRKYLIWSGWSANYINYTFIHYFGLASVLLLLVVIGYINFGICMLKLNNKKNYSPTKIKTLYTKKIITPNVSSLLCTLAAFMSMFDISTSKIMNKIVLVILLVLMFVEWLMKNQKENLYKTNLEENYEIKNLGWIDQIRKKFEKKTKVNRESCSEDYIGFLLFNFSYLIFFILFVYSVNTKYIILYVMTILIYMIIYCHSKMLLINPLFAIKYNLFQVKYIDCTTGNKHIRVIITTKSSLNANQAVSIDSVTSKIAASS
ncbi:hypothetical protein BHC44_02750 [Snodgrassella alvi]|nr:hypothetical protein BHC44_02750 [Snodgrassella alvi]